MAGGHHEMIIPGATVGGYPHASGALHRGQSGHGTYSQPLLVSGPQENTLSRGINTEIHNVAAVVERQVDSAPDSDSLIHAPFDPNLICPMCRKQFRIGEIQKYRQHVKLCCGTSPC